MFDLKIINNKPIITSLIKKEMVVRIYTISSWEQIPKDSITHKFTNKGEWVQFPFSIKNKNKIVVKFENEYHSFILPNLVDQENKKKIICVGLNKTGTTSLKKGLEEIGLVGFPEHIGHQFLSPSIINGAIGSTIDSLLNPEYDFYEDMPFSFPKMYEKFFKFFPNEKYILTVRDSVEEWIKSVKNFYGDALNTEKIQNFDNRVPYSMNYANVEIQKVYNWGHPMFRAWGLTSIDNIEEKLKNIYLNHIRDFKEFMKKNNGDYMIINVSKKDELKKLSLWLGVETNINNFGHYNKTNR